jgi:hypothetical protein
MALSTPIEKWNRGLTEEGYVVYLQTFTDGASLVVEYPNEFYPTVASRILGRPPDWEEDSVTELVIEDYKKHGYEFATFKTPHCIYTVFFRHDD